LKVNRLQGKRKLGSGVIRYQLSDIREQISESRNQEAREWLMQRAEKMQSSQRRKKGK